jgi:hypothetical protein
MYGLESILMDAPKERENKPPAEVVQIGTFRSEKLRKGQTEGLSDYDPEAALARRDEPTPDKPPDKPIPSEEGVD